MRYSMKDFSPSREEVFPVELKLAREHGKAKLTCGKLRKVRQAYGKQH